MKTSIESQAGVSIDSSVKDLKETSNKKDNIKQSKSNITTTTVTTNLQTQSITATATTLPTKRKHGVTVGTITPTIINNNKINTDVNKKHSKTTIPITTSYNNASKTTINTSKTETVPIIEQLPIWLINNNGHMLEIPENRSLTQINKQIIEMAAKYAPLITTNQTTNIYNEDNFNNFKNYLDQCINTYKKGNGELRAEAAGKLLNLNIETIAEKTRQELKNNNNSLLQLIEAKFKKNKETKLSGDTVLANTLPTDPESLIAYNIAEYGIHLHYDKEFKNYNKPIPPRPLQERIPSAILALVNKTNDKNRVVVIQLRDIPIDEQAKLHFQSFHWKHEVEKDLGRLLIDLSNSDIEGYIALNEGTAKQDGIDAFGKVIHPTIEEHLKDYREYLKRENITWKDCYIGKDDIEGAFSNTNYSPESAMLICSTIIYDKENIQNSYIMVTTAGAIGGTTTPGAFEVLLRPVTRKIKLNCKGVLHRYVDDYAYLGRLLHVLHDKALTHKTLKNLLGPEAIQTLKDLLSQAEDVLAFHLNLLRGEIRPKDKAFAKLTFIMFVILDTTLEIEQKVWQAVTSLTFYYAPAIRGMTSFCDPFRDMIGKSNSGNKKHAATATCKFAIEIWRIALYLIFINKECMSVPIDIFYLNNSKNLLLTDNDLINTKNIVIQGDAGTDQLAVAFYEYKTEKLIAWTTFKLPYSRKNNKDRHTYYEYLVFMLAQILMYLIYPNKNDTVITTYQTRNDNKAAISWGRKHMCSSKSSQYACMVVNLIQIHSNILMIEPEFITGIDMGEVDAASRNKKLTTLTPDKYIHIQDDIVINNIFIITNPYITTDALADQHAAYLEIHELIKQLKHHQL